MADVIKSKNTSVIETFFNRRKFILIAQSNIQGKNWVSINVSKMVFLLLSLVVFTHDNINLSQGEAIAMFSYISQFLNSIMLLPIGVETFSRMKDVISRIESDI
jgi:hypothetical protein